MCGIAGTWKWQRDRLHDAAFDAFIDALAHRGPDGRGVWKNELADIRLGHRRLAILDISDAGKQPMQSKSGRYWITFNGEIYNYIELKKELESLGSVFVSNSDTEVILEAYEMWGEACQLKFNGMWAFAIWDDKKQILFLSRDRFGVKPLYYIQCTTGFAFASETKAFLHLPGYAWQYDNEILAETLLHINDLESSEYSLIRGVTKLKSGYSMKVYAGNSIKITQWWNTSDHILKQQINNKASYAEQFRELLHDACAIRLRSDVPVATSLSGGLDSSAIAVHVAQLRATTGGLQKVFIAHFPGTNQDELSYAMKVAEHACLDSTVITIDPVKSLSNIESLIWQYEDIYWVPLVGPSLIYKAMRAEGYRVTLDGHGADELLGGYHFFIISALFRAIVSGDYKQYKQYYSVLQSLQGGGVQNIPHSFLQIVRQGVFNTKSANTALRMLQKNIRPHFLREPITTSYLSEHLQASRTLGSLNNDLYEAFHTSVLPIILRNFDRASMGHGVEIRSPFLDWRLVTFAFGLDASYKIGNGYTKNILRQSLKGMLVDNVRLRTNKIGFTSPTDSWLRGPLATWLHDIISSTSFLQSSVWNGPIIKNYVEDAWKGKHQQSLEKIWPYVNAHVLGEQFKKHLSL